MANINSLNINTHNTRFIDQEKRDETIVKENKVFQDHIPYEKSLETQKVSFHKIENIGELVDEVAPIPAIEPKFIENIQKNIDHLEKTKSRNQIFSTAGKIALIAAIALLITGILTTVSGVGAPVGLPIIILGGILLPLAIASCVRGSHSTDSYYSDKEKIKNLNLALQDENYIKFLREDYYPSISSSKLEYDDQFLYKLERMSSNTDIPKLYQLKKKLNEDETNHHLHLEYISLKISLIDQRIYYLGLSINVNEENNTLSIEENIKLKKEIDYCKKVKQSLVATREKINKIIAY